METIKMQPEQVDADTAEKEQAYNELFTRYAQGVNKLVNDIISKYSLEAVQYATQKFSEKMDEILENANPDRSQFIELEEKP